MAEDLLPSRAALLELRDEREVMQAGQAFLDEKRTLIAATLVRMLQRHHGLQSRFRTAFLEALEALRTALARHGLEALQAYPREPLPAAELKLEPAELLGVALLEAELRLVADADPGELGDGVRSMQAERCRQRFAELLPMVVELAALEANLRRLYEEYRKTERRASALEDVMIPDLDEQLHGLEELLEAQEIEEAVRVRVKRQST
jgi:V/A-type H+/Na+-transporting ATPase subunit D